MKYVQCEGLTIQSVDDEMLILDVSKDKIHQLNQTACFVWANCNGANSQEMLADLLVEQYEVDPSTAKEDVSVIVQELLNLELIRTINND